ncbi:Dynein assembly factor 1, axonemal [Hondaea fermentalgiana]|uniref:Dynein assembly factor 1, axonemal n=1 Tax=Hondaea fermentalgiana TaxID=2315210 RepID=A0A2R5GLW6_9STRA|nr:Dynein assembly factor 1, axonemal [Hondaea fermentalgiana]|eukprot:GBG29623.1 Dynein assembly factor 1, axonemal [Hondaea fermentalgiana]
MMSDRMASWLSQKTQGHVEMDENGVPIMSPTSVRALCLKNQGYECEEINDKLYLHFQGFKKIGGLEKYTGVKCLYLESNGIDEVSGLGHLTELRCLYLQQNLIRSIAPPAFQGLECLVTLDVSGNLLQSLEGLACLPALETLNAAKNRLSVAASTEELTACPMLTSVDLRGNTIEDGEALLDVLARVPKLSAMYLQGNPCVRSLKHYRKAIVARFEKLTYLDERPVDAKEKTFARAWASGGQESEAAARQEWKANEAEKARARVASWKEFQQRAAADREAEIAAAKAAGLPIPQPKSFVSYRTVDSAEEDQRQDRRRALALAEAEAERQAVLGHGIQMMGMDFARETAERNGSSFAPEEPPVPPVAESSIPEATPLADAESSTLEATSLAEAKSSTFEASEGNASDISTTPPPHGKADGNEQSAPETVAVKNEHSASEAVVAENEFPGEETKTSLEETEDGVSEVALQQDRSEEELAREKLIQESLKLHYARKEMPETDGEAQQVLAASENSLVSGEKETREAVKEDTSKAALHEAATCDFDLPLVQKCVRESLFDFGAAAAAYTAKSGLEMDATQCRLAFVQSQKKSAPPGPPSKTTQTAIVKESPSQDIQTDAVGEALAVGRPMPKVQIQAPAQLPSFSDFDQDEDDPVTSTSSDAGPECIITEDSKEGENEDTRGNRDDRGNVSGEKDTFAKRLTRFDILKSLHGNTNHPLNAATSDLAADSYFEDMD